jgi:enoyl-CoA hydratase/carnithine racemase
MSFVKVERRGNYAVLALAREPVNSLNTEVWSQLKAAFDDLEADPSVRGVIFTSGLSRPVFTAGRFLFPLRKRNRIILIPNKKTPGTQNKNAT